MSDVAKQAGISRQAVYLHFPSRAELLIATTRYIDQVKDIDGQLAQVAAHQQDQSGLTHLSKRGATTFPKFMVSPRRLWRCKRKTKRPDRLGAIV